MLPYIQVFFLVSLSYNFNNAQKPKVYFLNKLSYS